MNMDDIVHQFEVDTVERAPKFPSTRLYETIDQCFKDYKTASLAEIEEARTNVMRETKEVKYCHEFYKSVEEIFAGFRVLTMAEALISFRLGEAGVLPKPNRMIGNIETLDTDDAYVITAQVITPHLVMSDGAQTGPRYIAGVMDYKYIINKKTGELSVEPALKKVDLDKLFPGGYNA